MIRTFWATPVIPTPLSPSAPIVPAVWTPCPPEIRSSSVGSPSSLGAVAVGADEVGAVEVVDDPVAVVVEPVRGLAWVVPGHIHQVRVFEAIAGVDVGDDDRRVADGAFPGVGHVDVGAGDGSAEPADPEPLFCRPQSWLSRGSSGSASVPM